MPQTTNQHRTNIHAYCLRELKLLVQQAARASGIDVSELIVKAVAQYIGAPSHMATVPRLPRGRKKKGTTPLGTPHLWAPALSGKSHAPEQ